MGTSPYSNHTLIGGHMFSASSEYDYNPESHYFQERRINTLYAFNEAILIQKSQEELIEIQVEISIDCIP